MPRTRSEKSFAGLSTGVKLQQYAGSLLKAATFLKDNPQTPSPGERTHIGIEPMLFALAMEFALKAWYVWDHNCHTPPKTHNLLKLFDALNTASKEKLEAAFQRDVAPNLLWGHIMNYELRDILDANANAFVEWRYFHEPREGGLGWESTSFALTLELMLEEFDKLYVTQNFLPLWTRPF